MSRLFAMAMSHDGYPLDRMPPKYVWVQLSTVLLAEAGLTLDAATDGVTRAVHELHPEAHVRVAH